MDDNLMRLDSLAQALAEDGQPAGTGKELGKSIAEAFSEPASKENSHYVEGYSDKAIHFLLILLLILIPGGIYFFWKTQASTFSPCVATVT